MSTPEKQCTLCYDLMSAHDAKENRHAQVVMKELGIAYDACEARSIASDWLFFGCRVEGRELPPYLRITDARSSQSIHDDGMRRVAETPAPAGQRYAPGTRVYVRSARYPEGVDATVLYTYAHAFGSGNVAQYGDDQYAVDIDGIGSCAWFDEAQLKAL